MRVLKLYNIIYIPLKDKILVRMQFRLMRASTQMLFTSMEKLELMREQMTADCTLTTLFLTMQKR